MAKKRPGLTQKGCTKAGRNKRWCEMYATRFQRNINKRKKVARHMKKHPNDNQAREAMKRV